MNDKYYILDFEYVNNQYKVAFKIDFDVKELVKYGVVKHEKNM